ncbi:creatininase family protein [Consotaella salsifontis]|uniref:Creatinine amidohydrolase n=1 Tax=Consotaella salsifontis TaxID=1365950 RepID=A0A1T4NJX6_9HYPH|nr:creatininase family protein [Consotaella salsifontis]SJZ79559.1 creatinine amidohydrolase [Consotaella salsifontis]
MLARRFEEASAAELGRARDHLAEAVAVLPIAATEQHGPHLPIGTDSIIADHMVEAVLSGLPDDWPVTFLPTMRIGASAEHAGLPGTLSHDWDLTARLLISLGEGLSKTGFRRLVFVSSHGGNTPSMDAAALHLRQTMAMMVSAVSWQRFGLPDGVLPEAEIAHGIHGGAVETALMLHFRPDLVRHDAVAAFPSLQTELERGAKRLRAHGRIGFAWSAGDLNPQGAVGDARLATPEIGRAIACHQAVGFIELLADMLAFDLKRLA